MGGADETPKNIYPTGTNLTAVERKSGYAHKPLDKTDWRCVSISVLIQDVLMVTSAISPIFKGPNQKASIGLFNMIWNVEADYYRKSESKPELWKDICRHYATRTHWKSRRRTWRIAEQM